MNKWVDLKRAAKITGAAFLKGDLADWNSPSSSTPSTASRALYTFVQPRHDESEAYEGSTLGDFETVMWRLSRTSTT